MSEEDSPSRTASSESSYPIPPTKSWAPHALPQGPNVAGRPVWEPPILDYSQSIDEDYEKKHEAVLKHTGGDMVRITNYMGKDTEYDLLEMYAD